MAKSSIGLLCSLLTVVVCIYIVQCKALPVISEDEESKSKSHTTNKRSSSSNSGSELCAFSEQSCHFYSHCIESRFHCGPSGFVQQYAQAKCEVTYSLQHSQEPCNKCIKDVRLYDWANNQEICFQEKLQALMEEEFAAGNINPDPPNCLQLERMGFELLQECYSEQSHDLFCSAHNTSSSFKSDLRKIVSHFRISDYYEAQVERALSNLVLSCGNTRTRLASSLLTSSSHSRRVVLCGALEEGQSVNPNEIKGLVADLLDRSSGEFEYSGVDDERRCSENYPSDSYTIFQTYKLIFVTWYPAPEVNYSLELTYTGMTEEENFFLLYQFQSDTPHQSQDFPECGDGRRQAGELCDAGVKNGVDCDFNCRPKPLKECSTSRFEPSICWDVQCGDGIRSASEECDDGNLDSNDGCSAKCKIEPHHNCKSLAYNRTSQCSQSRGDDEDDEPTYPPATTSTPTSLSTLHSKTSTSSPSPDTQHSTSPLTSTPSSDSRLDTHSQLSAATPSQLSSSASASLSHWRGSCWSWLHYLSILLTSLLACQLSVR